MQTATINVKELEKYTELDIQEILRDWGNRYIVSRAALRLGAIDPDDDRLGNNRPQTVGWAALWHRNGHDYIHRSKAQPFTLNDRGVLHEYKPAAERLFKLLTTEGFRKQMKGEIVLYKSGAGQRDLSGSNYPIRLTDGRYCFYTGNSQLVDRLAMSDENRFTSDEADLLFRLWMNDNIVMPTCFTSEQKRIERISPTKSIIKNRAEKEFKKRCWKIFMLLNYFDEDSFEELFNRYSDPEVHRAGFLVWQRGEIITRWEGGVMPHPKY